MCKHDVGSYQVLFLTLDNSYQLLFGVKFEKAFSGGCLFERCFVALHFRTIPRRVKRNGPSWQAETVSVEMKLKQDSNLRSSCKQCPAREPNARRSYPTKLFQLWMDDRASCLVVQSVTGLKMLKQENSGSTPESRLAHSSFALATSHSFRA